MNVNYLASNLGESVLSVPSKLAPYLVKGENILKEWVIRGQRIYATQYRVFFVVGGFLSKKIVEASYGHISSIEFTRERRLGRLIWAILLFILSYVSFQFVELFGFYMPPEVGLFFWGIHSS